MRSMSRRQFIGATTAIGGGLCFLGNPALASIPERSALEAWERWRGATPRRLSDTTHALAQQALSGAHGRALVTPDFALDEAEMAGLSPDKRYAHATRLVAEKAPLRILPGERVIGSATLRDAASHQTPVAGGSSISHTTLGFHRVLKTGYKGLREQVAERLARGGFEPDAPQGGADLLESMAMCLDAAEIWRARHMEALEELAANATGEERDQYLRLRATLQRVPENPPETFEEAVQSLWFMYGFQRLMGTWSGVGRIDEMLGSYLDRDLAEGRITLDEARELLAHFWVKGCEWIGAHEGRGSGDAQHYQNIILGGVDADGKEVTNEVTYLVLDVVEELHISDFPIAVRLNANSPRRLLERMAEVQRHGGGIVAMYNEDVVIDGMVRFGYPLEEARTFTNDGCWEVIIPGRTTFSYSPFDALVFLSEVLGVLGDESPAPEYATFDDLYQAYLTRLGQQIDAHNEGADGWANWPAPTPLVSLFVEDCIESGRGYYSRGARYTVLAPHAGRLANVANSLLAIKTLVYDEQSVSLAELVDILRDNWAGQESLRQRVLNRIPTYGNDDDVADAMMARLFNDYAAIVAQVPERVGVKRPCGISTFGREIGWSMDPNTAKATADGHHQGAVLATNFSPSPGTDRVGPTAVLKSYCKMDFTRTPNGATVELKVHPESARGETGRDALVALMRTFVSMGGMFLHIDVVDSEMLKDAQANPDKYPNLAVRISGWSARFATLDKHWQDMVIQRTQQYV